MDEEDAFVNNAAGAAQWMRVEESAGDGDEGAEPAAESVEEVKGEFRKMFAGSLVAPEVGLLTEEMFDFLKEKGFSLEKKGGMGSAPGYRVMAKLVKILRYLKEHRAVTSLYAVCHIFDEPLLDDVFGNLSQQEFADKLGLSKAAVNKACMDAAEHFKTGPRRDQRKVEARKRMSKRRIAQLR